MPTDDETPAEDCTAAGFSGEGRCIEPAVAGGAASSEREAPMSDGAPNLQPYLVARGIAIEAGLTDAKEHDDLEPKGTTLTEVLDHWLACRADILDVGLGHLRYCLTSRDVAHLSEHLEKWVMSRPEPDDG